MQNLVVSSKTLMLKLRKLMILLLKCNANKFYIKKRAYLKSFLHCQDIIDELMGVDY